MRKWVKSRIDNNLTPESSKDNDGKLFHEFSNTLDYIYEEFDYLKGKIESKYNITFNHYHKRLHTVEEWDRIKDIMLVEKRIVPKKPIKLKVIKDSDWGKKSAKELSREDALERFYHLKEKEKKQKLLGQAKNVGLLLS